MERIPDIDALYAINTIGSSENFVKMLLQMTHILPMHIKQMDEYINHTDLDSFRVKVHGIKGSMRQAGHLRIARFAEDLEAKAAAGNAAYCQAHYAAFRDELRGFFEQLSHIFESVKDAAPTENADIRDYLDTLQRVKAAIEDFDSLLATDLLSPLTTKHFDADTDALIAKVYGELEMYRPEAALAYLAKLVG